MWCVGVVCDHVTTCMSLWLRSGSSNKFSWVYARDFFSTYRLICMQAMYNDVFHCV